MIGLYKSFVGESFLLTVHLFAYILGSCDSNNRLHLVESHGIIASRHRSICLREKRAGHEEQVMSKSLRTIPSHALSKFLPINTRLWVGVVKLLHLKLTIGSPLVALTK